MEVKEIGDLDHDRVIWEVVVVGHRLDVVVLEEDVDFLLDAPRFVEVPVEDLVVPHQDVEVHQEEQVRKHALIYLTLLYYPMSEKLHEYSSCNSNHFYFE